MNIFLPIQSSRIIKAILQRPSFNKSTNYTQRFKNALKLSEINQKNLYLFNKTLPNPSDEIKKK
jgi:hypothetical protein